MELTASQPRAPLFSRQALLRLIIPLVIEQLLLMTVGMADTVMVTTAGEAAVSGVSLVDGLNMLLIQIFAALSTVTAVFENILACWMDRFGISRGRAVLANLVLIFLLSLPCLLGNNLWSGVKALGMGIMDWEDFLVSNNLLPIGSMIYLLFCCVSKKYGWGYDHFLEEANQGRGVRFPAQFRLYFKYVLPVIVLIIFIMGYWDKFKPFIVAALGA